MAQITDETIDNWFTYHKPTDEDQKHYAAINEAAVVFAKVIRDHTPTSTDQTFAIRQVRNARMTANAAIACKGT